LLFYTTLNQTEMWSCNPCKQIATLIL
jgi:hypothetical protein